MFNFGIKQVWLSANGAFYWLMLDGDYLGSIRSTGKLAGRLGWYGNRWFNRN